MIRILFALVVLSLYIVSSAVCAISYPKFEFSRINTDEGLSQSSVVTIIQDSRGFMWFGTYQGLCRYDGHRFKVFYHNPKDSSTISNDMIWYLAEGSNNNLWVATWDGGLNRFNRDTETFTRFKHDPDDPNSLPHNIVRVILFDKDNQMWVGTEAGLCRYDEKKEIFIHYNLHKQGEDPPCRPEVILSIAEGNENDLWVGTDCGLVNFNKHNGQYVRYEHNPADPKTISRNGVTSILLDSNNQLWAGTWGGGLNLFEPEDQTFQRFQVNDGHTSTVSNDVIMGLMEDDQGRIWVATRGSGLDIYYPQHQQFVNVKSQEFDLFGLSSNILYTTYRSSDGIIWVGTDYGGLNLYDPEKNKIRVLKNNPTDPNSLSNNLVTWITEDSKGIMWIGVVGGFNRYDKRTNQFKFYPFGGKPEGVFTSGTIRTIHEDKHGNFWITSDGGGLAYFNPVTGHQKVYKHDLYDSLTISQDFLTSLIIDHKGVIWIGTQNSGINILRKETEKFDKIRAQPGVEGALTDNRIKIIIEDNEHNIWVGTNTGGLNMYCRSTKKFHAYKHNPNDTTTISENNVIALLCDGKGNIWAGTMNQGLNRINRATGEIKRYSTSNGLSSNRILGLVSDNNGNIWASTNHGLNRLNPTTGEIKSFFRSHGLSSDEFYIKSYGRSQFGNELYFGSSKGVVIINPDELTDRTDTPQVAITELKVFNQPVDIGEKVNDRVILPNAICESESITLSYKDAVFSLGFAALHFVSPDDNKYAYMLEGFDKQWFEIGNRHEVTYTNLEPGKYIFRVRASNSDGYWNEEGASLTIYITPPFWDTIWFKALALITVVGFLILAYLLRVARIKQRNAELERVVEKRTKEVTEMNSQLLVQADELNKVNESLLERQNLVEKQSTEIKDHRNELLVQKSKLEKANISLAELNATKDRFFNIIAHDLISPFSSLMGFLDLLKKRYQTLSEDKRQKYINIISETTNSLFDLLQNLLQWSRSQSNRIVVEPELLSAHELVRKSKIHLMESAAQKSIHITECFPSKDVQFYADMNIIHTVLRNLIWNAIKFTNPNGEIKVGYQTNNEYITFFVSDNGVGISPENMEKLFCIGSNISTPGTKNEHGTGLGLMLCKELVEKHSGTISVDSHINTGTRIEFRVPLKLI